VGPRTLVLPTQNGVDTPAKLGELVGAEHVLGGYARITSLLVGPGEVQHTAIQPAVQGAGVLPTSGAWAGAELQRCAAAFSARPAAPLSHVLALTPSSALRPAAAAGGRERVADNVAEADDDGALQHAVCRLALPGRPAAAGARLARAHA